MTSALFEYITKHPIEVQERLHLLRDIILQSDPGMKEEYKWKVPYYSCHASLCYLMVRNDQIAVGFTRGVMFSNTQGALTGEGMWVRHLIINSDEEVPQELFRELLQEGIMINEELFKNKK